MPPRTLALALSAACVWAAAPAAAQTPLAAVRISTDVTAVLGGVPFADESVAEDDLAGGVAPVGPGGVPAAADVAGYHVLPGGAELLAFDTAVSLPGGRVAGRADVVRFDGGGFSLELGGTAAGIPAGAGIDALGHTGATLLLSLGVTADLGGTIAAGRAAEVLAGGIVGIGGCGVIATGLQAPIHDLVVTDSGGDGVKTGIGSLVWNVISAENGDEGFLDPGVLRDRQALRNGGSGVLAQVATFPCVVTGSLCHQNGGAGIAVARGTVRGNLVTANTGAGYAENNFFGNNGGGVQVTGATVALGPNGCNGALCP